MAQFSGGRLKKAGSVPVGSLKLYRDCVKKILPGEKSLLGALGLDDDDDDDEDFDDDDDDDEDGDKEEEELIYDANE